MCVCDQPTGDVARGTSRAALYHLFLRFRFFLIVQKQQQISTQKRQINIRHQFGMSYRNFRKINLLEVLRKPCFSDVLPFWFKRWQCLKSSRIHVRFEARRNPKSTKDVKLNALQNSYPRVFFNSCSENSKLQCFTKPDAFKTLNFMNFAQKISIL